MQSGYLPPRDGVRLAYVDFGGVGPSVLLLHGLYGRATTWSRVARWLTPHFHVVALDQRGHGQSDKPDNAYQRQFFVDDARFAIDQLGLGNTIIIGHSMGALNGWVLAAQHPELVTGLVLEDMSAGATHSGSAAETETWLRQWPVPFGSLADVREYFGAIRPGLADYFIEVMAETEDGYRPLFRSEHMIQAAAGIFGRDWWTELDRVTCPTLVVKGALSDSPRADLQEMSRRLAQGTYVEIEGACHTVSFDQPAGYRQAVEPFLRSLK
ncbi:MAG: alpha/beta fold hydrolase [Mycobacterium leprae]